MNATIKLLEVKKGVLQTKINNYGGFISKMEEAYESLLQFKSIVEKSQDAINSANSGKESVLDDVNSIENCQTATKYYDGMKQILSGTGTKVVGITYITLLLSIKGKLKLYLKVINDTDNKIRDYQGVIEKIDAEIAKEKENLK